MHDITFESGTSTHYTAVIDGVAIEFSTAMNKIKYGDCDALSEYVDSIEQFLAQGLPLAPLSSRMNGVNMLRLLIRLRTAPLSQIRVPSSSAASPNSTGWAWARPISSTRAPSTCATTGIAKVINMNM